MVKQGDELAYAEIFHRYWDTLYAIAYNRLSSKQEAEDIVQEVFASLWKRRFELDIKSLQSYLATATKYAVFQSWRKALKQYSLNDRVQASNVDGAGIVEAGFMQQILSKEIDRLPEKCKLVFKYSRERGLSNKEIAEEMNISVKMVEAHLTKALKQLKARTGSILLFLLSSF